MQAKVETFVAQVDKSKSLDTPVDYVVDMQNKVRAAFISALEGESIDGQMAGGKKYAKLLRDKIAAEKLETRAARINAYDNITSQLKSEQDAFRFLELDAKMNEITRRVRVDGSARLVQESQKDKKETADYFEYAIEKFKDKGLDAKQVQTLVDRDAVAWFSLTAHPTNPTTVEYAKAGIAFNRVLASPEATGEELKQAIATLIQTPLVGGKKNPVEEGKETLATLDVIYDNTALVQQRLRAALDKFGYEEVKVSRPVTKPATWRPGDGDGNPNATAQTLAEGIAVLRTAIKGRYIDDLQKIGKQLSGGDKTVLEVITGLQNNITQTPEELQKQLSTLKMQFTAKPHVAASIQTLSEQVATFGFHYAHIDIRHEANDIMRTVGRMAEVAGLVEKGTFKDKSDIEQQQLISGWLQNPDTVARLQALKPETLQYDTKDKEGEIAARVFGRMQVSGRNPDMADKLIIAECKHAGHALAALLVLQAGGNQVANDKTKIDIVTLTESAKDLDNIRATQESLLADPTYLKQVQSRRQLITMIAKSDTVRRDGRGAEGAQEKAAEELFALQNLPELEGIRVSVFNGGGAPVQRGGGRVQETAHRHAINAVSGGAKDKGPSTLTVQGHHQQIVFAPIRAADSLEAFAAQNMYAAAKAQGLVPLHRENQPEKYANAREHRYAECKVEREAFGRLMDNPAFDELFFNGPFVTVALANVSSRPSSRPDVGQAGGAEITATPASIKGKNPKMTALRAIGAERTGTHSRVPLLAFLGVQEGLQHLEKAGQLQDMYQYNKSARDSWRGTAMVLSTADFNAAWEMMIGDNRPDDVTVAKLAATFDKDAKNAKVNDPKATLAWLEQYARDTEKLLYKAVVGREWNATKHGEITLGATFRKAWPEVAKQTDSRERQGEFACHMEAFYVNQMNQHPEQPMTALHIATLQAVYVGADMTNVPEGDGQTLTRRAEKSRSSGEEVLPDKKPSKPVSLGHVKTPLALPKVLVELVGQGRGR